MRWTTYSGSKGSEKRRASLMLICRPDQSPLHILNEKLSADPARVVLRPFHLAWASNVPEPSRAAQLVADIVALDEDQAEIELGLNWKDFSERHWPIGKILAERFAEIAEDLALSDSSVSPVNLRLFGDVFFPTYSYINDGFI